jgi:hypothetical protein
MSYGDQHFYNLGLKMHESLRKFGSLDLENAMK